MKILGTTALLLLAPLLATPGHAAAASDLCFGQAPTIVGAADQDVLGTPGADVIVATDARSISADAGDDRICVIGELDDRLLAGPGDDQVDTTRAIYGVTARLGAGSDTLVGGSASEQVDAGDAEDVAAGQPPAVDHISTGGGRDRVASGAAVPGAVNADVISTGPASDRIRVRGSFMPSIDGGGSDDSLYVRTTDGGAWAIDAGTGAVSRDGVVMGPVTHVTSYQLERMSWGELTFVGSAGTDELWLTNLRSGRVHDDGPVAADLGGGADWAWVRSEDAGSVAGGPGSDTLYVEGDRTTSRATTLKADLEADTYHLTGRPFTYVPGWEKFTFNEVYRSTVLGSHGVDRLTVWGCGTLIQGRAGNDHLTDYECDHGPKVGARIEGGPGNDRLEGTVYDDQLIGGPGRDYGLGGGGHNRCAVEVKGYGCH